ncbi:2-oxo acid dehydrogenase subunit E2 [archaeon]|jgi:pyruvate dehydrogenase E2 component (dihydrolipoamide acetyltransferase)|nr:2-oxo acid dehydrogenase subunit E2 [archaeon]MBT4352756.1 2-oxo acid dehydrogenase subunit E2 [archaeon]MBT4648159.1 2-oxo acid dehydrogenase subunit E2 [archaeon]MBT6822423.1 2-oxo acid dehydrogenase subunit E2 [archaeon]MBT7391892.1 2-oxo acid dehydrogenase subunit E2 [archaeon]
MVFEFKFPDVGEGIHEGEIVKWLVKVGDKVKADQNIAEIETDKAIVEIPCPKTGIIHKIFHKEGEIIKVGDVLVEVDDGSAPKKPVAQKKESPKKKPKDEHYTGSVIGFLEEASDDEPKKKVTRSQKEARKRVRATPKVRRLAKVLKVDINLISGTGPGGRIIEKDIHKSADPGEKVVKEHGKVKRVPFKGLRKTVADKMLKADKSTVPVTNFYDCDVTSLWDLRESEKEKATKKGVKLTFLPYIIKATVSALKKNPMLNSSLDEGTILIKQYYNIGFAVDTEDGLIVPVIKDCDKKNMYKIAKELSDFSVKARDRKLTIEQMKGGSFSISNLGSIGVKYFTPIINYPECAILGVGRIEDKPRVVDDKVVIRKILPLSVSYDHRLIDGATASRFMVDLMALLVEPKKIK